MLFDSRDREWPEDVGRKGLLSFGLLKGLLPELGAEFDDSVSWPALSEDEQVAQVGPGLDAVELAAGHERDEVGVPIATVVAADEEPVLSADSFSSQLALAVVVGQPLAAVFDEAAERSRWLRA